MESNTKSANAEKHLQSLLSYHTEEGNHLKTNSLEQNFEGTYDSVATAKTRGEVRAGLS